METWKRSLVTLAVFVALVFPAFGDKRKDNIDIILALDKSVSMADNQKLESVKKYVDSWVLEEVLIPGDLLVVISFYGKAEVIVSRVVKDEKDKKAIKALVATIRANGRFTDIGNALDVMKGQLEKLDSDGRKKFLLLMTDGKQEAPPSSKYYSPNGTFNHEFLANTKTIQKTGWKVQILGIGTETAAKELATELKSSYGEITDTVTPENLRKQTENLLGSVSLSGEPRVSAIGQGGEGTLSLTLKTDGYSKGATVSVSGIDAKVDGKDVGNVLAAPQDITVAPSGTTTITLPLRFPSGLDAGDRSGSLSFTFNAGERFTPSDLTVRFTVKGIVESYWWVGIAAVVVLAGIALLVVFLVRRGGGGGQLRYSVAVDGEPIAGGPWAFRRGSELFLNEVDNVFSLEARRNAKSVARLRGAGAAVALDALKEDRFPKLTGPLEDAVGSQIVLRAENGKKRELTISAESARSAPIDAGTAAAPAVEKPAVPKRRQPASRGAKPSSAKKSGSGGSARTKRRT